MSILKDKTIVVGVSGGIAAYKAAELVRLLVTRGACVRVMMTRNATEFITPLTLQTLSLNPVATETFSLTQESEIGHIRLADSADAITLPRFRSLDLRVETKPDLTPVSEADRAVEDRRGAGDGRRPPAGRQWRVGSRARRRDPKREHECDGRGELAQVTHRRDHRPIPAPT